MRAYVISILLCLAAFTGTSFAAQAAAPNGQSLLELARPVWEAVMHGQWWLAAAAGVVLLCSLARKYMPASWKEGTKGDIVGTLLAFAMAFAGMLATTFAAPGAHVTGAVFLKAAQVGVLAIGGYTVIHKLAGWIAAWPWFQQHAPMWLQGLLRMAAALFGSDALKKAEAAGDAAVVAHPATGLAGADGVKDVE